MDHQPVDKVTNMRRTTAVLLALLLTLFPCFAAADDETSVVKLPLNEYTKLSDLARDPKKEPVPAPASYALGTGTAKVEIGQRERKVFATVELETTVQLLEDEWVAVPLLPAGSSVTDVRVDGQPVELISSPRGLLWSAKAKGTHRAVIRYAVDGLRTDGALSLSIPTPQLAGLTLQARIPESDIEAAVIPSAASEQTAEGDATRLTASIPGSAGFQIQWRSRAQGGHSLSRATYRGTVEKNAVVFTSELTLDIQQDDPVAVKLLPQSAALRDLKVDDKAAAITVTDGFFTTSVRGRGAHKIALEFQVSFDENEQPRSVDVEIPEIPVSKFELSLPGKKELTINPVSHVAYSEEGGKTLATAYVPMTGTVSLSWVEAVPEEVTKEVRASATVIHTAYAEEGVLFMKASALYEITRGETSSLSFTVPHGVQINRISGPADEVADWKVDPAEGGVDKVSVYLNREVKGEFPLQVSYDLSLSSGLNQTGGKEGLKKEPESEAKDAAPAGGIRIPLLRIIGVDRQRGMVALLSSKEIALKPLIEKEVTKVGENQLPADVRQGISQTIAHTYKYGDAGATLVAEISKPEKVQGKFDAAVNTLISLSDVTMKGAASIDFSVKSGALEELVLQLPKGVNFLSLSGPSLRTHKLVDKPEGQQIEVSFTQEMEGQFRLELAYERILGDTESDVAVPTVKVAGAEVEQGKIAVEALSAVEVQTASLAQLSTIDPSELPQQLVLKTTNPILLAFKYVHVDPPYSLALRITRHKELEVQEAAIDRAVYQTLVTKDGVTVTSALLLVRNSRRQFLRMELPAGSEVWSTQVDGKPEKPARASAPKESGREGILVKIINSSEPFPVQILYHTPAAKLGKIGFFRGVLPRPDIPVANSSWSVYLPSDLSYGRPDSSMNVIRADEPASFERDSRDMAARMGVAGKVAQTPAPQLNIPLEGRRFMFEKVYANKTAEDAWVSIPYSEGWGSMFIGLLVGAGVVLALFGVARLVGSLAYGSPSQMLLALGAGAVILGATLGYLGVQAPGAYPALVIGAVAIGLHRAGRAVIPALRRRRAPLPAAPGEEPEEGTGPGSPTA